MAGSSPDPSPPPPPARPPALPVGLALQIQVARLYCGHYMTSLDMAGVSLTLMNLPPAWVVLLDAPTNAPAWPAAPRMPPQTRKPRLPLPDLEAGGEGEGGAVGGAAAAAAAASPEGRVVSAAISGVCKVREAA